MAVLCMLHTCVVVALCKRTLHTCVVVALLAAATEPNLAAKAQKLRTACGIGRGKGR